MYGISKTSNELDEYDSEKNPITAYARTKYEAEKMIIKLANDNFCVTCLRPSTVFGVSPRLRTDIVYNNLISSAVIESASEQPALISGIKTFLSGLKIFAVSAMK